MLTDEVCETKWISFFSRKTTTKLIDQQSKMIPQKTKFFTKLDEQSEKEIEEEEEPNTYTKRKSVFKKMRERKEINYLEDEYQKFKDLNQKFEKKDFFLPIYPNEKAVLIFDNLKNDRLKEKQKDILEMMDVVPGKKHQTGQDIQMSGNKFATYETFLSENESKLKTSLMNINPFIFNTKRKRCEFN